MSELAGERVSGVGSGGSRSPEAEADAQEAPPGGGGRRGRGLLMAVPHVRLYEMQRHRLFHRYLDSSPVIPVRLLREVETRRRLFVEGCKAREEAFDANPPPMASDARAFALALAAARAPLAD